MRASLLVLMAAVGLVVAAPGCAMDTIPDGLRKTPDGHGPKVVFDLTKRPLPDIPVPNDTATFADPTSRTGRRINVSLVAPTGLEIRARRGFGALEGWGTFAPISVSFEKPEDQDPTLPALDLDDVVARTIGDGFDPSNDPFYLIDLTTGLPAIVETGNGLFPATVIRDDLYWPNDPRRNEDALLFETAEEGEGLAPSQYAPALDTDFDGIVDHPNTWPQKRPPSTSAKVTKIDQTLTWYERETDTLILRPAVPLEEKHEYAVVLTDRLKDRTGRPVRSPFANVHHVAQSDAVKRVATALADPSKGAYYGDIAGTGLDHVAFAWSFTTGPQTEDMFLLRDGLHGKGPFAYLARDFPVRATAFRAAGLAREETAETEALARNTPSCKGALGRPYIAKMDAILPQLKRFIDVFFGLNGPQADMLIESLKEIDHLVLGTFESPYFIGEDPKREDPDGRFELDFKTGAGRVRRDTVHFWLAVPKTKPGRAQPFPVTTWSHGTTLNGAEILIRAGYFAKQGTAMLGIDMPGHGLVLSPGQEQLAEAIFREQCIVPWVNGVAAGRAHDLDEDGVKDSGGYIWSAHIFHSRDNIRQSVVDLMQSTRLLRSFDGVNRSDQDFDGDGRPDLAGDFDGDGVPDVGRDAPITTAGNSFGGILAMVHGAVDANVSATGSISGGGGLVDVATRSTLTPDPVLEQVMGPLVLSLPQAERKDDTVCAEGQRSVRFLVNDLIKVRELEIACLPESELPAGATVVVTNVANKEVRCARVDAKGAFRTPIPTDVGDKIDVQVYPETTDAVTSYGTCELRAGVTPGRRITTWEVAKKRFSPVGDESRSCAAEVTSRELAEGTGCQQFRATFFPVGTTLVAPQEGLGLRRQSREVRRLLNLTQAAIDSGDPINFAPLFARRARFDTNGERIPPRAVAEMNTVGDPLVPVSTGFAFARAAGALPFLPPEAAQKTPAYADLATPRALYMDLGGKTPDAVLRETHVMEGVSRLARTSAGAACRTNTKTSPTCGSPSSTDPACRLALGDPDWLSEGKDLVDAPHPAVPLRLARDATISPVDADSLERAWAPRALGRPLGPTDDGYASTSPLLSVLTVYGNPAGYHVWANGDPCRAFDHATHATGLLVRYLATGGRDLYVLSHPKSHGCLADESCGFLRSP